MKTYVHPDAIAEGDVAIIAPDPDDESKEWLIYGTDKVEAAADRGDTTYPAYYIQSFNEFGDIAGLIAGLRQAEVTADRGQLLIDGEEKVLAWPTEEAEKLRATRRAIGELVGEGLIRDSGKRDPDGRIKWEATPEEEMNRREAHIAVHPNAIIEGEPTVLPAEDGTLVLVAGVAEARRYMAQDNDAIPLTFLLDKRMNGGERVAIASPEEAIELLRESPDRIVKRAVITNQDEAREFLGEASNPEMRDWTRWYQVAQEEGPLRLEGTKVVDTFTLIHLASDAKTRGHKRLLSDDLIARLDPEGNHLVLARPAWEPSIVMEDLRDSDGKGTTLNDMTLGTAMPCLIMAKTKDQADAVEAKLDVTLYLYAGLESIQTDEETGVAVNKPSESKITVTVETDEGEEPIKVTLDGVVRNARLMKLIEAGVEPEEALTKTLALGAKIMALRAKHGLMARPTYTCAVPGCHLRLNRVQDAEHQDRFHWMHSRAAVDRQHVPEPVREEEVPSRIVCDFCLALDPPFLIGCRGMDPGDPSFLDCWATCETCQALIESGRWPDLTDRSLKAHMEVGQGAIVPAHERNAYRMYQHQRLERVHGQIADNYAGDTWDLRDVQAGVAGPKE